MNKMIPIGVEGATSAGGGISTTAGSATITDSVIITQVELNSGAIALPVHGFEPRLARAPASAARASASAVARASASARALVSAASAVLMAV